MATMGRREVADKERKLASSDGPFRVLRIIGVDLIATSLQIQTVATLAPASPEFGGLPIMREGFITQTGYLKAG
jgi:hypothetical protein